jgi:hypothetical protein
MNRIGTFTPTSSSGAPQIRFRSQLERLLIASIALVVVDRVFVVVFISPSYWPVYVIAELVIACLLGIVATAVNFGAARAIRPKRGWIVSVLLSVAIYSAGWLTYIGSFTDEEGRHWLFWANAALIALMILPLLLKFAFATSRKS